MKIYYKKKLSEHTTFGIGGVAEVFVEPVNLEELTELMKFIKKKRIKYYILGNGSNILVSDKGLKGCVIHIGNDLSNINIVDDKLEIEAGALMSKVAKFALDNELKGFERLSGIPGSIGGAITMNAGAYDLEMKDIVHSVKVLTEKGEILTLSNNDLGFDYRNSIIPQKKYVVVSATLELENGTKDEILKEMEKYKTLRESKQPVEYRSAGSIFKRSENYYPSVLIDRCFLKGEHIGAAEVSEKHAGFIVNKGNAKALDVYKLIQKVQDKVEIFHNTKLDLEIKLWGQF